jgi:hypothetical protein
MTCVRSVGPGRAAIHNASERWIAVAAFAAT